VEEGWFWSALGNMKRKQNKPIKLPTEEIPSFFIPNLRGSGLLNEEESKIL
jgi:hypothetical protein